MLVVVIVLVATNLATLAVLVHRRLQLEPVADTDTDLHEAFAAQRPDGAARTRRLISVEILNPLELARARGRIAGLAGAIVPNLTTRIVYDQTLKILRAQLTEQDVAADVRLHTLRPARPGTPAPAAQPATAEQVAPRVSQQVPPPVPQHETVTTDHYVDEIDAVDLEHLGEDAEPEPAEADGPEPR